MTKGMVMGQVQPDPDPDLLNFGGHKPWTEPLGFEYFGFRLRPAEYDGSKVLN